MTVPVETLTGRHIEAVRKYAETNGEVILRQAPALKLRYVEVHGVRYLRVDDVAAFIHELGTSEETGVRVRLDEAAWRILQTPKEP